MKPEFLRLVNDATEIATAGRWAGRDVRGVFDTFIKWGAATEMGCRDRTGLDWIDPLAAAKQDLSERALRNESSPWTGLTNKSAKLQKNAA